MASAVSKAEREKVGRNSRDRCSAMEVVPTGRRHSPSANATAIPRPAQKRRPFGKVDNRARSTSRTKMPSRASAQGAVDTSLIRYPRKRPQRPCSSSQIPENTAAQKMAALPLLVFGKRSFCH